MLNAILTDRRLANNEEVELGIRSVSLIDFKSGWGWIDIMSGLEIELQQVKEQHKMDMRTYS